MASDDTTTKNPSLFDEEDVMTEESEARHTSGPFYIQGSHLIRKFAEDRHIAIGPAPTVAYQDEVVSLLNKGTHYDEMLDARRNGQGG